MRQRFTVTLVLDLEGREMIPATEDAALAVTGQLQGQAEWYMRGLLSRFKDHIRVISASHINQFPEEADYPTDGTINWNMVEALTESNYRAVAQGDNQNTVGFSHDQSWTINPQSDEADWNVVDAVEYYGDDFLKSPFCKFDPNFRRLDEDYD